MRKPNPKIYELALQRLGVQPEEAVFLDDLGANLKPAKAMGITTIKVLYRQFVSKTMPKLQKLFSVETFFITKSS